MNGDRYLADALKRFREAKAQCDRALAQVPVERWTHRIDPDANSLATLMLHLSGSVARGGSVAHNAAMMGDGPRA